ncbi:branched-chain amino acid ABC transporter permease [Donghicola tyrosinivorans]|uniref:Branched-chain amino acid transport system permease protein n=1 Tax=Donghicola tyrosinivorans TaxID=1652492 RepID=A0A2T0WQ87_9RHOB|nr:branched-chain amino acid ABC transporter permease [Donghicola tyrosinivorans]PRY88862.1 branched-chain amino acid transport system permease protein [Donghicola tyrosinivorans]
MATRDLDIVTSAPLVIRFLPTACLAVAVLVLAAAPWWAGRADLRLLMEVFAYLALAQMWNLLAGYTGLVSVGQQAFVGLGGYLFFALTVFAGIPVLPAMGLAALLTGLIAVPTAGIAFRLNGAYFAIGTWVIAEVFRLLAAQIAALGGGSGISLPAQVVRAMGRRQVMEMTMYYTSFAIGISSVLFVWLLLRSRWGLALAAIRDSELAVETLGVNTQRVKVLIYIVTAAFTALAGSFFFLQKLRITPDAAFSLNDWTAFVIFIVVIGGIGTIEGPILGVIVFFALREIASDWGAWYLMLMGASAIAVMLIDKRGLYGWLKDRLGLVILPTSRHLD